MKKTVLGLMAVVSSFALMACGDDTGTGGGATTGTTVTGSGASTKTASVTGSGASTTKASSASSGSGNSTSGTGGGGESFNLILGPGWPHGAGTKHEAAIVIGGNAVQTVTADGGDSITFAFTDIPAGAAEVHYYADVNGNDSCDAPPADHAWIKPITVDGEDKTFQHTGVDDWMDSCATF